MARMCRLYLQLLLVLTLRLVAGRQLRAGDAGAKPAEAGGTADVSADIYGGSPAPEGMFDFMVSFNMLVSDENGNAQPHHTCGGALIAPDAVLTAAHCVVQEDGNLVPLEEVVLGISGEYYQAAALHVHPDFELSVLAAQVADFTDGFVNDPPAPMHDIALFRLETPVPNATLALLPAPDLALGSGQALEVAGWGVHGSDEGLPLSDVLQYTSLELAAPFDWHNQGARGTCPMPSFTDTLCALNILTGANSCAGDSGGPLLVRDYETGEATVVGIVSHGPPCDKMYFGIYTDVRLYASQIAEWTA